MFNRYKPIVLAEAEVGYLEKASCSELDDKTANAGHNNWTKYARDLDAIGNFYNYPKNGFEWCDMFYDWLVVTAFGAETAKKLLCQPDYSAGAGCYYSQQYYRLAGRFFTDPEPGDQIFFTYRAGDVSHTGIVVAVEGSIVTTIEGNNADGVNKCSYSINDSRIYGYGRPDWGMDGEDPEPEVKTYEIYTVRPGDTLSGIAMTHGSTVDAIIAENKISNPNLIYVGQLLKIPDGFTPAPVQEDAPASDPAPEPEKEVPGKEYTITLTELSEGCNGSAVETAQNILIAKGYTVGGDMKDGREIGDGIFGAVTAEAVRKFQATKGLAQNGIIGADTMSALLK